MSVLVYLYFYDYQRMHCLQYYYDDAVWGWDSMMKWVWGSLRVYCSTVLRMCCMLNCNDAVCVYLGFIWASAYALDTCTIMMMLFVYVEDSMMRCVWGCLQLCCYDWFAHVLYVCTIIMMLVCVGCVRIEMEVEWWLDWMMRCITVCGQNWIRCLV